MASALKQSRKSIVSGLPSGTLSPPDKSASLQKQKKQQSFCSSVLSIFKRPTSKYEVQETCTTSETSDGGERSPKSASKKLSITAEIKHSRQKMQFMTNYTLIEGLRTIQIPGFMHCKDLSKRCPLTSYSGHSKRGQSVTDPQKKNQDALIMLQDESSRSLIFACLDGHGIQGEIVSQFVKERLETQLLAHPKFVDDVKEAITDTIARIEDQLFGATYINCDASGTTLVIAVIRDSHITVGNVGDSRVMVISKEGPKKYECIPLSYDHKPDDKLEMQRIKAAGGRVMSVTYADGTTGPQRVWRGDADAPGLAMSRSIGDRLVHKYGVISTPDFLEHEISVGEDVAMIVASDGLWNVLTDKEVVRHTMSAREPSGAVGMLLRGSHNRWVRSGGDSVDDTTIAVAFMAK